MSTVVASTSPAIRSSRSSTPGNSWPSGSPSRINSSKRQCRCAAEQGKPSRDSNSTRKTLSSLDSLLNTQQQPLADGKGAETVESASTEAVGKSDEQRGARGADAEAGRSSGPWWAPPPEQEGKPRTTGTPGGKEGKFLDDSFLQNSLSEARTGGSTKMGEALDIPTVTPRVTYLLLGANLAVYAVGVTIALLQGDDASNNFFFSLAKVNEEVVAGDYWRLVTANFMHAGLLHLGLNTLALAAIGPEAEAVLGYGVFSLIYLLTGASGSVVSLLVSDLTTVGASGSLFGLVGALVAYFVRNSNLQRSGLQVAFLLGVTAANLALGFQPDNMIDNSGHIAGFVAGFYLGYGMGPRFEVVREADIPEGSMAVQPDVEEKQVVIDQTTLLEKAIVLSSFAGSLAVVLAVALIARGNPVDDIPL